MRSGMLRAGLAALSMTLVLSACGDGGGGRSPLSDTPLERALAATPATNESTTWWGFTDVAAIQKLGGFDKITTPYGQSAGYGYGSLAQYMRVIADYLPSGSDPNATAVSYGEPPNAVVRLTGVADIDTTYGKLEGERSDLEGGTLLIRRGDGEIDLSDETFGAPIVGAFNATWYHDGTVVTAGARRPVEDAVSNDGDSMRDAEAYRGAADCLGDAVAAQLTSAKFAGTPGNIAIGVRDDDGTPAQVLCVKSDEAGDSAKIIEKNLDSGTDKISLQAWSKVLKGAEVDTTDGWVRVTLTGDDTPAIFYQLMIRRGLSGLLESS